jgi:hypothetical protein
VKSIDHRTILDGEGDMNAVAQSRWFSINRNLTLN